MEEDIDNNDPDHKKMIKMSLLYSIPILMVNMLILLYLEKFIYTNP